ncbi:monovalent cation/H(+) antiporter subunit G [Myroides ceti]|uniref:Monovalent cation/H(+) antiporter subunit G n=2 Tax=Paenimyroides ceti TaxID=395087 RepID=A0ABT8CSX0_9FLAO|nr:monovalent cation/H(+) antiporter subunit G [Paenimyroides ceti]MDN3707071.1 monovalent cation/H(+) antiporter subunit G [Paenimyroides ceti]MDN3708907.1 monovalent cation/H(+) antiporter subunit G [Paenimyroides ceti]
MMTDIFIMALSTIGALFILIASYGIYRMPDFYARLSVTIKAATMGIGCILAAAALHFSEFSVTTKALAIVFFLFLTSPVAGFLIGRVAYFTGTKLWKHSIIDEMRNDPESSCAVHEKKKEEPVKKPLPEKEE